MYYLSWRGKISGPYEKEKIVSMLQKGLIGGLHQVSEDCVNWQELSKSGLIPEKTKNESISQATTNHPRPVFAKSEDSEEVAMSQSSMKTSTYKMHEEKNWFIYRDNRTFGPYPERQMQQYAQESFLLPTDLICDSKNRNWQPAGNVFELHKCPVPNQNITSRHDEITFGYLIPWDRMLNAETLKKDVVKLLLVFALTPMLISAIILHFLNPQSAIEYNKYIFYFWGIYFCIIWAGAFSLIIKPAKVVWLQGLWFVIFTVIIGMLLLFNSVKLPVVSYFYAKLPVQGQPLPPLTEQLLGFIFGVGVCEELTKALPFLFFALSKKYTKTEFIFLGMMSGFGFAIAEGVNYSFENIAGTSSSVLSNSTNVNEAHAGMIFQYGNLLTDQLIRYITLPILHASWAGIFGWFFATALSNPKNKWFILGIGLAFLSALHGVYNTSCSYPGWNVIIAGISFVFLCGYMAYGEKEDKNIIDLNIRFSK